MKYFYNMKMKYEKPCLPFLFFFCFVFFVTNIFIFILSSTQKKQTNKQNQNKRRLSICQWQYKNEIKRDGGTIDKVENVENGNSSSYSSYYYYSKLKTHWNKLTRFSLSSSSSSYFLSLSLLFSFGVPSDNSRMIRTQIHHIGAYSIFYTYSTLLKL